MMFLCENCAPKEIKWLFNLTASVSTEKCDQCHQNAECVNIEFKNPSPDEDEKSETDSFEYFGFK